MSEQKGGMLDTAAKPTQEVLEPDYLSKAVQQIEHITDPQQAQEYAHALVEADGFNAFRIGGVLNRINEEGWFSGYPNFREYVENELNFSYRKARYCIQIYNGLLESQVSWDEVKELGWTKISKIIPVLSAENVHEWVETAKNSTVPQLEQHVKNAKNGDSGTGQVTSKNFKLHDEQAEIVSSALENVKAATGTESDGEALNTLAMAYLNNEGVSNNKASDPNSENVDESQTASTTNGNLSARAKQLFYEIKENCNEEDALDIVFDNFGEVWPEVDITVH